MADHPAVLMREAAGLLRGTAKPAAGGPWHVSALGGKPVVRHSTASVIAVAGWDADARWIALAHPGVGVALAGWLEAEAGRAEHDVRKTPIGLHCRLCGGLHGYDCHCWDGALATARAVLREAQ